MTLAEYFGLDIEALEDYIEWAKQCQEEDEAYQMGLVEKRNANNT